LISHSPRVLGSTSYEPSIAAAERFLAERAPGTRAELGYDPLDLDSTRYGSGEWRRAFARSSFGDVQHAELANPQTIDRDGVVAFFASMGWIGDLPDQERSALLEELRSLVAAEEYVRPWTTHAHGTRLD